MDLFEQITESKKDFPKFHTISKEVKKFKFNFYQGFAIVFFIVSIFLGIIFGNLFAACKTSAYFYSDTCYVKEFNFSLMITIWFIGLLISMFIYSIGQIIGLLTSINEKLGKI
jgi:hypothetical protein